MSRQSLKPNVAAAIMAIVCLSAGVFAQITVLVNNIGYEQTGAKRAIVQSGAPITEAAFEVINSENAVVWPVGGASAALEEHDRPASWSGEGFGYFKVADFSGFTAADTGYRVRVGAATSASFAIGEKLLQSVTGADQVNFFYQMRHGYHQSDDGFARSYGPNSSSISASTRAAYEALDSNIPIFGSGTSESPVRRNLRGGWWDATGDAGKHLSHLAYSNYFTPQQIPMVVWALLHANEANEGQKSQLAAFGDAARDEAAWGADYLLRSLSPEGFFYMSIFDNWGAGYAHTPRDSQSVTRGDREICAWGNHASIVSEDPVGSGNPNSRGFRSADYQSALREGGGVSIAALARAYKAGVSKDSSAAQYLAGAKRAYAHLMEPANYTRYQDDGVLNIIDFYAGLLAATELYNATDSAYYLAEARRWVDSLLSLQTPDGWFYSGNDANGGVRPFYHAAEEGFPVVALSRFYSVAAANAEKMRLREAIGKNLRWYNRITYNSQYGANPFEYARMWRAEGGVSGGDPGTRDLARDKPANASREEEAGSGCPGGCLASHAFDGDPGTRWSSYSSTEPNDSQWISVDLGKTYKISSVVLRWEAALGKHYIIQVSSNGADWAKAFEITDNTVANQNITHSFDPVEARYVRMYGIERGIPHGGFSLFTFEVYGEEIMDDTDPPAPGAAHFFIPKKNETGYWWQGENARLASMASAFILGAPMADHTGVMWSDTLFAMATAQLDWILGRNPFDLTMMHGYGRRGYDHFPAAYYLDNIKGGICNGISSMPGNENNIAWRHWNDWMDWRFMEQWLPHNAWYLVAISSLSYRIDNPIEPEELSARYGTAAGSVRMRVTARGRNVRVELPFAADQRTELAMYNMRGRRVFAHTITPGARSASVTVPAKIARGAYILSVSDMSGKNKISNKIYLR